MNLLKTFKLNKSKISSQKSPELSKTWGFFAFKILWEVFLIDLNSRNYFGLVGSVITLHVLLCALKPALFWNVLSQISHLNVIFEYLKKVCDRNEFQLDVMH